MMHKCPVCQSRIANADPDISFAFGIVLRDVIPMDKIAPQLCPDHEILILSLFEMLIEQNSKYQEIVSSERDVLSNILTNSSVETPDKDSN